MSENKSSYVKVKFSLNSLIVNFHGLNFVKSTFLLFFYYNSFIKLNQKYIKSSKKLLSIYFSIS